MDSKPASEDSALVPSPDPEDSAVALVQEGQGGGVAKPAKTPKAEKKKEPTVDWGKFNHLVENFTLIYGTDTVWDGDTKLMMKIGAMGHAYGADMVRMWKASERRRTVPLSGVVFDPTMSSPTDTTINLYDGLAMVPKQGDVEPILDLIRFLFSRAMDDDQECDDVMHWFLCWLAYPLQHPGAKLRTAVVMHGDEGAGKNFLFDIMIAIYGKYGALVGQDELEDKFNDWRSGKLFVVGDEVSSRAELVHNKNRLKSLITSPTVQINPKGLPRREERNCINIVFLSNELQPLALDNSDRRYLVIYTPLPKEIEYYLNLSGWLNSGGAAAFHYYLMNYCLDGFSPFAPAPMTKAKQSLIGINRKSPEVFWSEWSDGELELPYAACSLLQAYQAYLKWCQRTGDRYPFKRDQFTPTLLRFAEAQGKPASTKVMKLTSIEVKKAVRMFLVAEPSPDIPLGQWATECFESFEQHLKKYLGYGAGPRPQDGEASGNGGAD